MLSFVKRLEAVCIWRYIKIIIIIIYVYVHVCSLFMYVACFLCFTLPLRKNLLHVHVHVGSKRNAIYIYFA